MLSFEYNRYLLHGEQVCDAWNKIPTGELCLAEKVAAAASLQAHSLLRNLLPQLPTYSHEGVACSPLVAAVLLGDDIMLHLLLAKISHMKSPNPQLSVHDLDAYTA